MSVHAVFPIRVNGRTALHAHAFIIHVVVPSVEAVVTRRIHARIRAAARGC